VPTARRSRLIAAPPEQLWEVVSDPHHLPRWWPRVSRVEDVAEGAFTEVMRTAKGKVVRADFELVASDPMERSLTWSQRLPGTPFARLLSSAETDVRLAPVAATVDGVGLERETTEVTIELRQELAGVLTRIGTLMVRRAAAATIEEALDGLERISG
jgi:uncharacterized protein YndB with AHSA1/START domain